MFTAWIRCVKEKREEIKRKYPNLAQTPVYLNVQILESPQSLSSFEEKEIEEFVKEVFQKKGMRTYPEKYPFNKKEKFDVIEAEGKETVKIWEGQLPVPKRFRGGEAETVRG